MPRVARVDKGNYLYHVINRAVMRLKIFDKEEDYRLFEEILEETAKETGVRVFAYTIMPNHWHLLLNPKNDGDLGVFMHRLTSSHTRKVKVKTKTIGTGPLYQGRYKSFLIQKDSYFLSVFKYIERNPVRANLCQKSEDWKWGSAWRRSHGSIKQKSLLSDPPVPIPLNYKQWVNAPEPSEDIDCIRKSVNKGAPYGNESWVEKTVKQFDIGSTLRNPGRPSK